MIEVEITNREVQIDVGPLHAATDETARAAIMAETAAREAADTALGERIDNVGGGDGDGTVETDDATLQGDGTSSDKLKIKSGGVGAAQIDSATNRKIDGALQRSGGTMTGQLTLHGDPSNDKDAATKKYVDDNAGSGDGTVETDDSTIEGDGSSGDKVRIKADGVGEDQVADALLAKINRPGKVFVEGKAPDDSTVSALATTGKDGDIWWVVDSSDETAIEMWDNAGGTWVRFYRAKGRGGLHLTEVGSLSATATAAQLDTLTKSDLTPVIWVRLEYTRSNANLRMGSLIRTADIPDITGAVPGTGAYRLQVQGAGGDYIDLWFDDSDGDKLYVEVQGTSVTAADIAVYNITESSTADGQPTKGPKGGEGEQGEQGAFYFKLHMAAASQPDKPTAGSYTLSTDSFTVTPATWTLQVPAVSTGERLWAIEAPIDPANDSGKTVDLTAADRWGAVYPITGEKGRDGIDGMDGTGTGTGTAADTDAIWRAIERQQHLTRGIHDNSHAAWEDADDTDGAVAYGIAVNNMIDLNDNQFTAASATIPAKTGQGRRLIYIFVRLPIATDRSLLSLVSTPGGTIQGNAWAELPVSGVNETGFDRDTYSYWWAETDLDEDPEQVLQLRKRVTVLDPTEWEDKLGATAEEQVSDLVATQVDILADAVQTSIQEVQHRIRDIRDSESYGEWETAGAGDGDLHQADISESMPTLLVSTFNGGGQKLTIPDDQNQLTQIYIRVLKTVDIATLSVLLNKGRSYEHRYPGNGWFSSNFKKPTSTVYDFYEVVGFQNGAGTTVELQKRDAISTKATWTGNLEDIPEASLDEDLRDKISELDTVLPTTGGTMTGALILKGDPTGDLEAAPKQYVDAARLSDLASEPDLSGLDVGDILAVDGALQKVAITDENAPNVFAGTIGSETIRTTSGREIRGIIGQYHPNGWTNDGSFTANPNGATEFLIADNERRLQWAVKQSEFKKAKGSAFAEGDKLAIKVNLASGKVDELVGAHFNTYSALVNGADTSFIIFSHRKAEGDGNYNLFSETSGTTVKIEYFTVDGDGNATSTPFFTHVVSLKHLVPFASNNEQRLDQQIQENAATIEALKANIQRDIDGIVGLAEGAAFVTALPDPDTYTTGTKVILTEDIESTVGNKTEVKFGRGVYGLADKPADDASSTKKWMSFVVGSGPDYRGFSEGFAGVTSDPLGDARPQYAYPPDHGNAVVSPLGDAISSFREHTGLVSGYDVAILTIKKAVYWELLEEIHGSTFGATTTPSITNEHFVVRMVRTDTGAVITNASEVFWFSRQALASFGETVTIAGVDYFNLYYSGDTRWFDGIPGGTTCLLTLEHRDDSGHHTFNTTVNKAWSRLDRHDPVTNELARLNGRVAELESRIEVVGLTDAQYTALATKDAKKLYVTLG